MILSKGSSRKTQLPVGLGLLGAEAIMLEPDVVAHAVEQGKFLLLVGHEDRSR